MMYDVLDEGYYCRECCYFEGDDFDGGRCMACGCDEDLYAKAQVVEVDS